jgi:hypothetical protein
MDHARDTAPLLDSWYLFVQGEHVPAELSVREEIDAVVALQAHRELEWVAGMARGWRQTSHSRQDRTHVASRCGGRIAGVCINLATPEFEVSSRGSHSPPGNLYCS